MIESIVTIPPPFNMIVLVVLIGSAAGVLTTIAKQVRKYACHRQDLDFKRELVDRGMTADEIAKIIESASPPDEAVDR